MKIRGYKLAYNLVVGSKLFHSFLPKWKKDYIRSLRTEGVTCCTDLKALWGKLGIVILACMEKKKKMTWFDLIMQDLNKSILADSGGDDNVFWDRRKRSSVTAIRLCTARPEVRQPDKYCSSYCMKKDKYQVIKFNLTGSWKYTSSRMKSSRRSFPIDQRQEKLDVTVPQTLGII